MKCKNCGFEIESQAEYCPNCGARSVAAENNTVPANNSFVTEKLLPILKDNLFFVLCIVITASCLLALAAESVPVTNILIAIFLWIAFAGAQKNNVDKRQLRNISGTVYAMYIVMNVASIIMLVAGVIVLFSFNSLPAYIVDFDSDLGSIFASADIDEGIIILIASVVCICVGLACLLINIFGVKKIHRFAKAVYQGNVDPNLTFIGMRAAKRWLVFFSICGGISAFSSLLDGEAFATIVSACDAAACFIPVMLINKHLE